ncbi:hypothetical protein D3C78_1341730 [compost metagenome]
MQLDNQVAHRLFISFDIDLNILHIHSFLHCEGLISVLLIGFYTESILLERFIRKIDYNVRFSLHQTKLRCYQSIDSAVNFRLRCLCSIKHKLGSCQRIHQNLPRLICIKTLCHIANSVVFILQRQFIRKCHTA